MRERVLKRLGERVRKLRTERGLTQEALAEQSEVHRTYVGDLERGERNPSVVVLVKLAEGLDVPVAELLRGIDGR